MSNGIYLTLEHYKDKDLPITIMINGQTYHSQFALATAQTTYFEMGKQHGMELGSDNTYSDKEMSRMHDAWYDEGYEAGKREAALEKVDQFNKGYEIGKYEGYEAGKKEQFTNNIKPIHEANEKSRKLGYDEGYEASKNDSISKVKLRTEQAYKEGYGTGYKDGITERPKTSFVDWLNSKKQ